MRFRGARQNPSSLILPPRRLMLPTRSAGVPERPQLNMLPVLRDRGGVVGPFTPYDYLIGQSLRFRANNSAHLSRTPASTTDTQVWTFSCWVKRGQLGTQQDILSAALAAHSSNPTITELALNASDQLSFNSINNPTIHWSKTTNRVFRDPSALFHLLVVLNTPSGTASQRARIYINGLEETSFAINTDPSLNVSGYVNNSSATHNIGREAVRARYLYDGYLSEIHFIDGQALTPSSFGQFDPTTNSWVPRRYTGTYGTNGFYLPFNDPSSAANLCLDRSGNGNNWTPSGISVAANWTFDQSLDTPTNNMGVFTALDANPGTMVVRDGGQYALYNGAQAATHRMIRGSLPLSTGKFYFEMDGHGVNDSVVNIMGMNELQSSVQDGNFVGSVGGFGIGYANTLAALYASGGWSSSGPVRAISTQTWGFAVDLDAGRVWLRDSTGWLQGDPATGTNPTFTRSGAAAPLAIAASWYNSPVSGVSLRTRDAQFAYSRPAGFGLYGASQIPNPPIPRGDDAMAVRLRTGTGATANVTGYRFAPDLVWIKRRDSAMDHAIGDKVRGIHAGLASNNTNAEYADSGAFAAFNSDGYTLGSDAGSRGVNISGGSFVDWAWREGAAYGFDIVSYTGDGVNNRSLAHGLGATPHFCIVKSRANAGATDWAVFHRNLTAANMVFLNSSSGQIAVASSTNGGISAVSSTAVTLAQGSSSIANVNGNTGTYIAYLWTSIPGFSLFGSYTGNGSSDGTFVWCGFRPRFILIKNITGSTSWMIYDAARNTFNVVDLRLAPDGAFADAVSGAIDITANGFKFRVNDANTNGAATNYIFAAFAEVPFKWANAR